MKVGVMPLVAYIGFVRKGFVCGVKKALHMTTHTGADRQRHVDTQCLWSVGNQDTQLRLLSIMETRVVNQTSEVDQHIGLAPSS